MHKTFSIKLTKPIVGKRFGVFQHIMTWAGSEKVDMRKYATGDSASQINWKQSAKHQELYTNIFQQEKSLTLDLFLDINYNRRWGKLPNREQAFAYTDDILSYCKHQQIAVTIHYPTHKRRGNSKLLHKESKQHENDFRTVLEQLFAQVQKTKPYYTSHLHDFLRTTIQNKKRRALVIFSDFLMMDNEAKQLISYLKKQHIVFLFQLPIDPEYGQNYEQWFVKKTLATGSGTSAKKPSGEIELL